VIANAQRIDVVPFFTGLRVDYGVDYAGVGALLSAYLLGYVLGQVPMGLAADNLPTRRVTVAGLALMVVTSGLFALTREYWLAMLWRFLMGISGAALYSSTVKQLLTVAPSRGTAMGVLQSGAGAGMIVGLVGLPNAGKSSVLARVSAAHPKIASYPFTTLQPQLGIADMGDARALVIADLPGLIEGAHAGHGLGDEFLRHIERTRVICQIVDMAPLSGPDPVSAYRTIRKELRLYSPELARKRHVIAANKMDLTDATENLRALKRAVKAPVFPISAATGLGLRRLLLALAKEVAACS